MTSSWRRIDKKGPHRESNPGPLAPEARNIPLDHEATLVTSTRHICTAGAMDLGADHALHEESVVIMSRQYDARKLRRQCNIQLAEDRRGKGASPESNPGPLAP
uniref:Uncharacterized protein n=1 Tax=Peronospora matthiolae TaxID=2874970 RepID=A0AAV1U8K8_9STRA